MQVSEEARSFNDYGHDELDQIAEVLRREADPADPMSREAALRTIGRIVGVETRGPRDTYQKLWG